MTEVLLVRHARAADGDFPNRERPLSEKGKLQARNLAVRLGGMGVKAVYSSPYLRAIETVRPLCEATGLIVHEHEGLRESAAEELLPEVRRRMVSIVEQIVKESPDRTIVICTHGGTLWGLISYYDPEFDHEHYRRIGTPDVRRLVYERGAGRYDPEFRVDI